MSTQTHTESARRAVDHLGETARYWEQKARDAEEGYNTLLQDHTTLQTEFDDVASNAEWLADIIRSNIIALPEAREALDASPGESIARMKAKWQAEGADLVAERALKRIQWYAIGSTDTEKAANHATLIANELRRKAQGGE